MDENSHPRIPSTLKRYVKFCDLFRVEQKGSSTTVESGSRGTLRHD